MCLKGLKRLIHDLPQKKSQSSQHIITIMIGIKNISKIKFDYKIFFINRKPLVRLLGKRGSLLVVFVHVVCITEDQQQRLHYSRR